jgi:SAM-dependent methyltransferase
VLELACGEGRITLPLARAGFQVTGVDSSPQMLDRLRAHLDHEPEAVRRRVTLVQGDMRKLNLDNRLWRYVCLPFNTLLMLNQAHERQQALARVREHLAPSGAFAFEIFTPLPRLLRNAEEPEVELDQEVEDAEAGRVRVVRTILRRRIDLGRQLTHLGWRHRISRGEEVLAEWEDSLDLAWIFPNELLLLLERQGFRLHGRWGGPDRRPYAPTPEDPQPQLVEARIAP